MLSLTVKITGKSTGDLELALAEVLNKVQNEYGGFKDSNEYGECMFYICGEEELDYGGGDVVTAVTV